METNSKPEILPGKTLRQLDSIDSINSYVFTSISSDSEEKSTPASPDSTVRVNRTNENDALNPTKPREQRLNIKQFPFPYQLKSNVDDKIRQWAVEYEIQHEWIEYLHLLKDYKIVILCDDSGSMKTVVEGTCRTRWDELRSLVKIIASICSIIDDTGVDVCFLNRPSAYNVVDVEQIDHLFTDPPRGYTPLVPRLRHIFQMQASRPGHDKKLLVFVATDGVPTDERGVANIDELEELMTNERQADTTHVMFLLCSDDPVCMDYLAEWDVKMKNVDVTDDYRTERETIRRNHGSNYPFSLGDYILKALLGAIDHRFDALNERF